MTTIKFLDVFDQMKKSRADKLHANLKSQLRTLTICPKSKDHLKGQRPNDVSKALNDFKFTVQFIKSRYSSINSQKTYFTLAISVINECNKDLNLNITPEAYDAYQNEMKVTADKSIKKQKQNTVSENLKALQQKITWNDIITAREEYDKEFNAHKTKLKYNAWLVGGFFTMIPPRRLEYASLKVYFGADPHPEDHKPLTKAELKERKEDVEGPNYLLINKKSKKVVMVLNSHKNVKTLGTYRAELPADLAQRIITYVTYFKLKTGDDLWFNKPDNFSRFVTACFKTIMPNFDFELSKSDKLSANDFRHVYITSKRGEKLTFEQREQIAMAMGQKSVAMQLQYENVHDDERIEDPVEHHVDAPVDAPVERHVEAPDEVEAIYKRLAELEVEKIKLMVKLMKLN